MNTHKQKSASTTTNAIDLVIDGLLLVLIASCYVPMLVMIVRSIVRGLQ